MDVEVDVDERDGTTGVDGAGEMSWRNGRQSWQQQQEQQAQAQAQVQVQG